MDFFTLLAGLAILSFSSRDRSIKYQLDELYERKRQVYKIKKKIYFKIKTCTDPIEKEDLLEAMEKEKEVNASICFKIEELQSTAENLHSKLKEYSDEISDLIHKAKNLASKKSSLCDRRKHLINIIREGVCQEDYREYSYRINRISEEINSVFHSIKGISAEIEEYRSEKAAVKQQLFG